MKGPFRRRGMPLYTWKELSGRGLWALPPNHFIGQAGMLVKRHVLDAIGYPWFKAGQFDAGQLTEDIYFCKELQDRGYTVWVDRDTIFEHCATYSITCTRRKDTGDWMPTLRSGPVMVMLPEEREVELEIGGEGKTPLKWIPDGMIPVTS
jgi:hypothetical protein